MQQQCSRDGVNSSILSSDRVEHLVQRPDDVGVAIIDGVARLCVSTPSGYQHYFFDVGSAFHSKLSLIVKALDAER